MKLDIRKATKDDLSDLVDILTQAVAYKVNHGDMAWGTGEYTNEEVKHSIDTALTYIALFNDKPVGTLKLQWDDDVNWDDKANAGYIHQLAVKTGFHGQDIGKQLIDWAARGTEKNFLDWIALTKMKNYAVTTKAKTLYR